MSTPVLASFSLARRATVLASLTVLLSAGPLPTVLAALLTSAVLLLTSLLVFLPASLSAAVLAHLLFPLLPALLASLFV